MAISIDANAARRPAIAAVAKPPAEFEIKRRLKLWVVLRDDVYCGSYPEEDAAINAAEKEIRAVIQSGGKARMRAPDVNAQ